MGWWDEREYKEKYPEKAEKKADAFDGSTYYLNRIITDGTSPKEFLIK